MTYVPLPAIVGTRQLTSMVNEIRAPQRFLRNLLTPPASDKTLHTDTVLWSVRSREQKTAGFVRRGGEALLMDGYSEVEREVHAPNIRLKKRFEPVDLLFTRRAGTSVFTDEAELRAVILDEIATHLQIMRDDIANTEEWMVAQAAFQGVLTYSSDRAAFTIDYLKPEAATIEPDVFWDAGSGVEWAKDIKNVKKAMHDLARLQPTIGIVGADAYDAIMALAASDESFSRMLTRDSNVDLGNLTMTSMFEQSGAQYVGRLFGVPLWHYPVQLEIAGEIVDLVRPEFIEFIHVGPAAERAMHYAAIPDMTLLQQGRGPIRRKVFSKSWLQEDPSELYFLTHTRPLPIMKRPGSVISLQIVKSKK